MGLGTTPADIDRLSSALRAVAGSGPCWSYRYVTEFDEYQADDTTGPMGGVPRSAHA